MGNVIAIFYRMTIGNYVCSRRLGMRLRGNHYRSGIVDVNKVQISVFYSHDWITGEQILGSAEQTARAIKSCQSQNHRKTAELRSCQDIFGFKKGQTRLCYWQARRILIDPLPLGLAVNRRGTYQDEPFCFRR